MPLREDILSPIPGDNPGGHDLRYLPVYEQIKEARREEEDLAQGVWQRVLKTADWPLVIRLASEAIAKKSKDLQLAVWLTEALVHREGFSGFQQGIHLCTSLLSEFWDSMFPELEEGDSELRSVPLAWLANRIDSALRKVPLTPHGISALQFDESLKVPSEDEARQDSGKFELRREAIEAGKTTPEVLEDALRATQSGHFDENAAALDAAKEALEQLNLVADERFGEFSPGFGGVKDTLDQLLNANRILAQRRAGPALAAPSASQHQPEREEQVWTQSDTPLWSESPANDDSPLWQSSDSAPASDATTATAVEDIPLWQASNPQPEPANAFDEPPSPWSAPVVPADGFQSREPSDAIDCATRLNLIAQWLRKGNPRSPAAYLLLRGFRWGELRTLGPALDPEWLEAPPTDIRQQLRRLAQNEEWHQLLEAGEEAMAQPCGRAWLDLQRYTLHACDELGGDYALVSHAITGALRSLLEEYPDLLESTLTDDTPTANAATRQMLATRGCLPGASSAARPAPAVPDRNDDTMIEDALRQGRVEAALELVSRRMSLETSGRGRFQRKVQLARILVASGRHAVSLPLLRELAAEIGSRGLSEWETPAIVVEPLVLLHRSLEHETEAVEERRAAYTLICRLDPVKAFALS